MFWLGQFVSGPTTISFSFVLGCCITPINCIFIVYYRLVLVQYFSAHSCIWEKTISKSWDWKGHSEHLYISAWAAIIVYICASPHTPPHLSRWGAWWRFCAPPRTARLPIQRKCAAREAVGRSTKRTPGVFLSSSWNVTCPSWSLGTGTNVFIIYYWWFTIH